VLLGLCPHLLLENLDLSVKDLTQQAKVHLVVVRPAEPKEIWMDYFALEDDVPANGV
jgi:hypothetical protein